MNEEWWKMNDEWCSMMISSCWGVLIYDGRTDERTNERTFVNVESLSRLKKIYIHFVYHTYCVCTFPSVSSLIFLWSSKRFLLRPKLSAEADTYAGADTCPRRLKQQIQLNIFQLTKLTFWHRSRLLGQWGQGFCMFLR